MLEAIANGKLLQPKDYGLESNFYDDQFQLAGPRWINFWDKDDPISFPVAPLFLTNQKIKSKNNPVSDVYCDVSDFITAAHNACWNDKSMHRKIAEFW